ncbi:hypothetical protein, variant 1 [Aphanomyces astaci]|uniref:WW domain-containing protein n=1 Tax=Aphanomyces astaci TaxID=112090 RepID=W4GIV1_APHAT|nr:hypothetical protein, variant 1 [Aphanomyces astaci]ETV78873.1 hypothetical protein, variant 1 [Aphanomyces astaci]|eukprot:XP_009831592.1 hypothetical protein, variant 1 [Aphanomyces astaci]
MTERGGGAQQSDEACAAATCIQKLYRSRAARKLMVQLASSVYRRCYDANTGHSYYCNLRTGETAWDRPKIFGSGDAPTYEDNQPVTAAESMTADNKVDDEGNETAPVANSTEAIPIAVSKFQLDKDAQTKIELTKLEGLVLIQRQAQAKADLERQNRKQVHWGRKQWDKKVRLEHEANRAARLQGIARDNKQAIQDLLDGKSKPQLESIREACMRGHVDRVMALLNEGWSPNAESAMGLTPLLAACLGGHIQVVQLLLQRQADVNHRHIVTQRTAYMEACQRSNTAVVRELLRHGARIHWNDKQGRVASDGITHKKVLALHELASGVWSPAAASVFPAGFRAASMALAFVAKCQRRASVDAKVCAVKAAAACRVDLHKKLIQAKVQFDHDVKVSQMQASATKRRDMATAADQRYDNTRSAILQASETASVALRRGSQARWLEEANVMTILAYCPRHWFDHDAQTLYPQQPNGKRLTAEHIQPTRKWTSASELMPLPLRTALAHTSADIQDMCLEYAHIDATHTTDVDAGVLVLATTKQSQATVHVTVIEARHLPRRSNRSLIDPMVRVRVHGEDGRVVGGQQGTEPRAGEDSPAWDHAMTFDHIPSIRCELHVQVVDNTAGGAQVAGEIRLPLRQYVDQNDHDEWHVLPPTLKQTLVEGSSVRAVPATLHLVVRFTHAKTLVLTREIAKATKRRQQLLMELRAYIQAHLTRVLTILDPPKQTI